MLSPFEVSALAATLGSGLVAGLCFAFTSFILRAFDQLGAPEAIRAMQSVNSAILRSSAMVLWFGTAFAGIVAIVLAEDRALVVVATALYVCGAILITGTRNVPLNETLERVDPDATDAVDNWRRYRVAWSRWNAIRAVVCGLASLGFAAAL